jgi:peptidoglycan/LPS O-acetylase OafA/YrhL
VTNSTRTSSHIAALDGLRGLAIVVVIISHFSNGSGLLGGALGHGAGQTGVMLFFCLSGFLMGHLYLDRQPSVEQMADFARRRLARVAPLYVLVVALSYALAMSEVFHAVNAENLWKHLLFFKGENYLWTVPVEVQFYAVFPLIWLAIANIGNRALVWLGLVSIGIAWADYPNPISMLPYFAFFAIGVAVSRVKVAGSLDAAFCISIAFFILSLPRLRSILGLPATDDAWKSPLYMLMIGTLVLTSAHSRIAQLLLGSPIGCYLGKISYSVYLGHAPVLYLSLNLPAPILVKLAVFLCGTFALATVTYYVIERPARRWIAGTEPRAAATPARLIEA